MFSLREIRDLVVAWLVLSFCFSVTWLRLDIRLFMISLITVGLGFVLHELSHKFTANAYGYWAEFRAWPWGLLTAFLLALATGGRIVFAAPGAVYIAPSFRAYHELSGREYGLIAVAGPLANMFLAIFFLALTPFGGWVGFIGLNGFYVNSWLAAFNMLPFSVLDGLKVFSWNKPVWALITGLSWAMVLYSLFTW